MTEEELKKKIADLIYNAKWQFGFGLHNLEGLVQEYWMDNEDEVIEEIIKVVKKMSKKGKKFVKNKSGVVGYISEDGKWFNVPYGMWSISKSDKFVEATKEDIKKYKSEIEKLERNREEIRTKNKAILDKIRLTEESFCRFREVYEEEDKIVVRTRENGVNGFSIKAVKSLYLMRRYNDEFDRTYAYYEFKKEKEE